MGARFAILVAVCVVCASLAFCGGTVTFVWTQYDGPTRPRDSIAIIRTTGASSTVLVDIDGKPILAPLEQENRLHVEVLPGIHDVDVAAPSLGLRRVISVRLLAEAGKVYRVEVAPPASPPQPVNGEPPLLSEQWSAHAYEVDRDTDARRGIADAPAVPSAPAAPAAPASDQKRRSRADASAPDGGGDSVIGSGRSYDAGVANEG